MLDLSYCALGYFTGAILLSLELSWLSLPGILISEVSVGVEFGVLHTTSICLLVDFLHPVLQRLSQYHPP